MTLERMRLNAVNPLAIRLGNVAISTQRRTPQPHTDQGENPLVVGEQVAQEPRRLENKALKIKRVFGILILSTRMDVYVLPEMEGKYFYCSSLNKRA